MTIHLRLSLRLDVSAKGQDWSGADGGPYSVYLAAGHIFGSRYLRVEVRRLGERGTAKVRAIPTSMHGALLETQIGGFRRWNLDELRLVKRNKPK